MKLHNFYYIWKMEKPDPEISCYFIQHVGEHCTLGQCFKILKTNHNALQQHLKLISFL